MKKILACFFTFGLFFDYLQAQTTYVWPIADAKPGTNIICKPQGYIGKEFNFADLFIAAPEGTIVVAPVDGLIISVGTSYKTSLTSVWGGKTETTIDDAIDKIRKDLDKQYDPLYVTGCISIKDTNGKIIHINGITSNQPFKTGQKITRGTPIGRVAYVYRPIKEAAIGISVDMNGKVADPMTPFGLKTTFIPPAVAKPIPFLTKQQLKDDFLLYIDILKECYPGLYDVISPEELERYVEQIKARIDARNGDWPFAAAANLISEVVAKIHDSHIYMHYPQWYGRQFKTLNQKRLQLAWINDTLICRNAAKPYSRLLNRPVKMMNGMSAEQLKNRTLSTIGGYDAGVKSYQTYVLAYGPVSIYCPPDKTTYDFNTCLEMADKDEVIQVPAIKIGTKEDYPYNLEKFLSINHHKGGYKLQMLNDSIAYIGLTNFMLNQVQIEAIAHFIDSLSKVPYLIIDVRNNGGGDDDVLSKLYSYIAGEPMTLHSYLKVNKQGVYQSFKYSMNRSVEDSLFTDYVPKAGKAGFYAYPQKEKMVQADSKINYKGKIYVLTNENSISAATLFPALLVRNHRGVVVGRETRTAYHFMNAYKFASIRLPHSTLTINVPLVYCCFDTIVNKRVPYGRGVLPDYEVPLTVNELSFKNGDVILNYTLQLIKDGKYLESENPFTAE